MRYRQIGQTEITVSEVGFGAWGIGGWAPGQLSYGPVSETQASHALHAAFEEGITLFDTSPLYGEGKSETIIGKAFRGRRDQVVFATKVGMTHFDQPDNFTPKSIEQSIEDSLRRLQTDYLDIVQLHNPTLQTLRNNDELNKCLDNLQKSGKVRCLGISVQSPHEGIEAIEIYPFKLIQANLNMLDTRAIECGLLTTIKTNGASLIARTPLCFGFLTNRFTENTTFPEHDHRNRWSQKQVNRWIAMSNKVKTLIYDHQEGELIPTALRFCLSYPEVSCVIPGIIQASEVSLNAEAGNLPPLSHSIQMAIEELNRANTVFSNE